MAAFDSHGESDLKRRRFLGLFPGPQGFWPNFGVSLLCLVLLLVVVNVFAVHLTQSRLNAHYAAYRAAGIPADFSDWNRTPTPDEANAAAPMATAAVIAERVLQTLNAKTGVQALFAAADDPVDMRRLEAAIAASPNYERQLQEADRRRSYQSPSRIISPYKTYDRAHMENYCNVVQLEVVRSRDMLAAGKPDNALRLMLRQLRLARKMGPNEPTPLCNVLLAAMRTSEILAINRVLRLGAVSDDFRDSLEVELSLVENARRDLAACFHIDRLVDVACYPDELPWTKFWPLRAVADNDKLFWLDTVQEQIDLLNQPYSAAKTAYIRRHDFLNQSFINKAWYFGSATLFSDLTLLRSTIERLSARARCLRVLNALQRQPGARASLASLPLPKTAITDPFNEDPLRILWKPSGVVIYSVGQDLKDDGGALPAHDYGLGPVEDGK